MNSIRSKVFLFALCGPLLLVSNTVASKNEHSSYRSKGFHKHVVYLEQGWDDENRAEFYQTTQGSRMLPYDWFLHLEQANGRKKFRDARNIRRMGYLVGERSDANPDGLPVGFARDIDLLKGDAIGLTCAACHTGQLKYNGNSVRIDGGQSLGDLEALQDGILASLEATLSKQKKFYRFSNNVLGYVANRSARDELFKELQYYRDWWRNRTTRSRGLTPHGPGRTDAFTIIGNEVACLLLDIPSNCALAVAPTQFPFLWDTPFFEWVQYNSSVHSPLGRNVGEVTGVFAETELAEDGSVISSANIDNLFRLEELLKKLRSPEWPEDILGAIDHNLAAEGNVIFSTGCAGCHTEDPQPHSLPNIFGVTFAKVNFDTPLSELKTDPTAALSFATRRADPGVFLPAMEALELVDPTDGTVAVASLLNLSGRSIIGRFFLSEGFSQAEQLEYLGYRESRSPTLVQLSTYKARPLNGIAFTAPYLHNGSVASIYELLLPPDERLKKFHVGRKKYDPVKLGYSTKRGRNTMLLDTTALGNSNSGHEFGTGLSHNERMAVIEYLKTL